MQAAVQDMYLELVDVDVEDWSPAVVSAEVRLTGTLAGARWFVTRLGLETNANADTCAIVPLFAFRQYLRRIACDCHCCVW